MSRQTDDMHRELERIFCAFPNIHTSDIPGIDLYMDQVTTFLQENLRGLTRDPDDDRILTKTMINNYVKNKVLIPPVKKKYSREHMMLLIMIYYMKNFLSIGDIRLITGPLMEQYARPASVPPASRKKESARKDVREEPEGKHLPSDGGGSQKSVAADSAETRPLSITDIYESVSQNVDQDLPRIREDILRQIDLAANDFSDVPEEERPLLQRFSLICRLSAEVCIRKLFIEKLLDADSGNGT